MIWVGIESERNVDNHEFFLEMKFLIKLRKDFFLENHLEGREMVKLVHKNFFIETIKNLITCHFYVPIVK